MKNTPNKPSASIEPTEHKEWWVNGKQYTEDEFNKLKDKKSKDSKSIKESTINFIQHVVNGNYKKAASSLETVVNEKIKQRILSAHQNKSN